MSDPKFSPRASRPLTWAERAAEHEWSDEDDPPLGSHAADLAELRACQARIAELEADLLEISEATGIVYEAEGHAPKPGPVDAIVAEIQKLRSAAWWAG